MIKPPCIAGNIPKPEISCFAVFKTEIVLDLGFYSGVNEETESEGPDPRLIRNSGTNS